MSRRERYRDELRAAGPARWPAFLRDHSGLPGPRADLELAQAVADEGEPATFDRLIGTDDEYLVLCGVLGLGRLLAGQTRARASTGIEARLRGHATDPRWRVREAVAMALQRLGDADLPRLLDLGTAWVADPHPLIRRAAVAAVCEPRLLTAPTAAARAVALCERATAGLAALPADRRRGADVRALRQALGYCWSVAVAADPKVGLPAFQALAAVDDADVAWIVRENSRKKRLATLLTGAGAGTRAQPTRKPVRGSAAAPAR
ncbi:HEAT repeat domain-containing protein [Micromonospora rifamycinica]|uniref:HEAT repeat-containing protein n=1 Tax=Micromonospora rifamycinica TaxID=291594 RepID=A0A1C5KAB0_9ACTN|nr:HEAT repeat domain-containing protein [Micromonospora rifamycinica]SCG79668.1 hypothetical protein GA0070623_4718 [Micromonospora rifamycinica]